MVGPASAGPPLRADAAVPDALAGRRFRWTQRVARPFARPGPDRHDADLYPQFGRDEPRQAMVPLGLGLGQASISLVAWWWLVPATNSSAWRRARFSPRSCRSASISLPCTASSCDSLPGASFRGPRGPAGRRRASHGAGLPLHHLASSWPRLLGLGAAGTLLYYSSAWLLLGREDREFIRGLVRQEFTLQRAS